MSLQIKNRGLVSIIVPIYNAEKWLGYCLNSIMAQTYPWFEAILVNDGSSDGSLQICREYAAIDSRFHVISVENGGVSRARNLGIDAAKGQWLAFIDSDDVPASNLLECLLGGVTSDEIGLVISSALMVDFSVPEQNKIRLCSDWLDPNGCTLSHSEFRSKLMQLIWHTSLFESPWGKLYSLPLWKKLKLRFPAELSLGEDFVTNLQYYEDCKNVAFVNRELYYYNNTSSTTSLTHIYRPDLFETKMYLMHCLLEHLGGEGNLHGEEWNCYCNYVAHTGLRCLKDAALNSQFPNDSARIHEIHKILSDPLFERCCQQATWIPDEFKETRKLLTAGNEKRLLSRMQRLKKVSRRPSKREGLHFKTKVKHGLQSLLRPLQRLFRFSSRLQTETLTQLSQNIRSDVSAIASKNEQLSETVHNLEAAFWQATQRFVQLQISELRQKKKALMLATAEHQNIGDAAITLAEQYILQQQFPEYYQVEFSTYEFEQKFDFLQAIVNPQDILFINGGGNLGSLYLEEEELHRRIIQNFPCNPIIILPQSIYFANDINGQQQLALSSQIYNHHPNLTIYARGSESLSLARKYFPNAQSYLMPDLVLALHRDYALERKGILVNLREDQESLLAEDKEKFLAQLQELHQDIEQRSNMAPADISRVQRAAVVNSELMCYASHKVVITDRLHGMLFSVATNTPCVVLDNVTGKSGEMYRTFFRDAKGIVYLGTNLERLKQAVVNALALTTPQYPVFAQLNFEKLRKNFDLMQATNHGDR